MERVHAAVAIAGGLVALLGVVGHARRALLDPVQAFVATALAVFAVALVIRGPIRLFHAPPLVAFAVVGVTYGALATAAALAFPVPRAVRAICGLVCASAGVVFLLLQLRVISP